MKPSSSSKRVGDTTRLTASHRRLLDSLNLGRSRSTGNKAKAWHFPDFGIQRVVLQSMEAFLDCITKETSHHPLVKGSVEDMIGALESILDFRNESLLELASNVAVKMVDVLPNSMLQPHLSHLVCPLLFLLSSRHLQVAVSCANALNSILSTLNTKEETKVWDIVREQNAVERVANNLKNFSIKDDRIDYFHEMVVLLSKMLWLWPPSRFCVWTDSKLLDILYKLTFRHESFLKVAVLQSYSNLALCGYGAKKLLENGSSLMGMMLDCMNNSYPASVRVAAFKLARCLMKSEVGCNEVLDFCCKPLVKAIIDAMKDHNLYPGKCSNGGTLLIEEVCRLALITRWAGDHQSYFWKERICSVLCNLLLNKFGEIEQSLQHLSLQQKINLLQEHMSANVFSWLRPYIWDILGGLVAQCAEDLNPNLLEAESNLNILITCTCLAFVESANAIYQIHQDYSANTSGSEPAARAVLLMVYSPCLYINSQSRLILSEILKLGGKAYLQKALSTLNAASCRNSWARPSIFQLVISSISVASYASLPNYRNFLCQRQGIETLLTFLRWSSCNSVCVKRSALAHHLNDPMCERVCCSFTEDWDGEDMLLLFSIWAFNELIHHCGSKPGSLNIMKNFDKSWLVTELQEIYQSSASPGSRWYSALVLCHFGQYGFPSELGRKIGKALLEVEFADLRLVLRNNNFLLVHKIILLVRCPSLLPSEEQLVKEKSTIASPETEQTTASVVDVQMSAHVDHQALLKLLEYVYSGHFQADVSLLRKLKVLAKHCDLQPLYHMLCGRNPRWGTPIPKFDLSAALDVHSTSDLILTSNTTQMLQWSCACCSDSNPHLHVHKVVLWSSCTYLQAMFHSGMQESASRSLKVPISWYSLVKLVTWFYSGDMPKITFGCFWENVDINEKVDELQIYVELCWLGQFWLLEDLYEHCYKMVEAALEADNHLSIKMIQLAADFSQWGLANVAATSLAPMYHELRSSGELDHLDESVREMVRCASVKLLKGEID